MKYYFGELAKSPIVSSLSQLEAYFLALDIIQGLADLDNAPKQLPGAAPQTRTEGELKAFDDGFTAAVVALHARGYTQAALALVAASPDMGVTVNLDIIETYVEVANAL